MGQRAVFASHKYELNGKYLIQEIKKLTQTLISEIDPSEASVSGSAMYEPSGNASSSDRIPHPLIVVDLNGLLVYRSEYGVFDGMAADGYDETSYERPFYMNPGAPHFL